MGGLSIWRRLLWKELRESGIVVVALLALPMVLFPMAALYGRVGWQHEFFQSVGAAGTYLLLILWAANKGDRDRPGNQFSLTHLPVRPRAFWAASFTVPALISTLLGLWFGFWAGQVGDGQLSRYVWLGALEFCALFSFSYYFALVVSKWLSMLIGIAHIVTGGSLIEVQHLEILYDADAMLFVASTALGGFAASLLFVWLAGKKSPQARQALSLLTMVVIAFLPLSTNVDFSFLTQNEQVRKPYYDIRYGENYTPQEAQPQTKSHGVVYIDNRTDRTLERHFKGQAFPLYITAEGKVYLAQQADGARQVHILAWDTKEDRVSRLASIPASPQAFERYGGESVDPRGRYMLISLSSMVGKGYDLWLVDLKNSQPHLIMPCRYHLDIGHWGDSEGESVTWLTDRVYFSTYRMGLVSIDFDTMKPTPVKLIDKPERSGI